MPQRRFSLRIVEVRDGKAWFKRPGKCKLKGEFWESVDKLKSLGYRIRRGELVRFFSTKDVMFTPLKPLT